MTEFWLRESTVWKELASKNNLRQHLIMLSIYKEGTVRRRFLSRIDSVDYIIEL